jgi:hypothetical protein
VRPICLPPPGKGQLSNAHTLDPGMEEQGRDGFTNIECCLSRIPIVLNNILDYL